MSDNGKISNQYTNLENQGLNSEQSSKMESRESNTKSYQKLRYRPPHRGNNNRKYRGQFNNRSEGRDESSISITNLSLDQEDKIKQRGLRFNKQPNTQNISITEQYGFTSRGEDTRLQKDERSRRDYFNQILETFVKYCADNTASSLHQCLDKFTDYNDLDVVIKIPSVEIDSKSDKEGTIPTQQGRPVKIDSILLSLRKLREALIHTEADSFTRNVFLFSIRVSAYIGHYQTYIPSINYLLAPFNIKNLNHSEKREVATILILHVAHFNRDYGQAIRLFFSYLDPSEDKKVLRILESYINNDYYTWSQLYNSEVDNGISNMMKFGVQAMSRVIVERLSSSYFNISLKELEDTFLPNGITFLYIKETFGVEWKQDGDNLIIKQRTKSR